MSVEPRFVDTNVFIQARNLHCGFDFCPAFWDRSVVRSEAENVASIERVGDEMLQREWTRFVLGPAGQFAWKSTRPRTVLEQAEALSAGWAA